MQLNFSGNKNQHRRLSSNVQDWEKSQNNLQECVHCLLILLFKPILSVSFLVCSNRGDLLFTGLKQIFNDFYFFQVIKFELKSLFLTLDTVLSTQGPLTCFRAFDHITQSSHTYSKAYPLVRKPIKCWEFETSSLFNDNLLMETV